MLTVIVTSTSFFDFSFLKLEFLVLRIIDADGEKRKKKMDRGMNLRPVTMDFLFQAGVGCIGLYAKYSPFGLFEKDKGPKVHPVSLGLQLHI